MKKKNFLIISISILTTSLFANTASVYAADSTVMFGSDFYESENGTEFPVGVYVDGDEPIGFYHVEINYDINRLEYLGGATSENDGTIVFEGNGSSERESTMLQFRALSGGETTLKISEENTTISDSNGERFDISEIAEVPVNISGDDIILMSQNAQTDSTSGESTSAENSDELAETTDTYEQKETDGSFFHTLITILSLLGAGLAAIIVTLALRKKKRIAQLNKKKNLIKSINNKKNKSADSTDILKEKPAIQNKTDITKKQSVESRLINKNNEAKPIEINKDLIKPVIIKEFLPTIDINAITSPTSPEMVKRGNPIIEVKNVSMTYNISNSTASGLKDYIIQRAKGKLKYRKLKALDNISFNIYKGEVVGIIGTNGSGKSTLLKIISGALKPTSGQVVADKDKIQLLTLGTGFDGELSARENVYLNGAIIGYSKDFIDKHYDEIINFAELQDFTEEKVKNFSSGMVSRLGFSIATVGGAADILILDEVLAVGDQFFRKKSMDRIKGMIHGGSTVLIVSHSLGTIQNHCTKVIWIEKGKLKMVDTPQKVCAAYSKLHTQKDTDEVKQDKKESENERKENTASKSVDKR